MTKLERKSDDSCFQDDSPGSDDIEIIEIVGMDERVPRPASAEAPEDEDEIILDLDEGADGHEPGDPAPSHAAKGAGEATPAEEQLLRLHADFENFKSRVERDRETSQRLASSALVARLLPVLDNFERAVSTPPAEGADRTFHDGVSLIFRQILEELRKEGLTAVDTVGEVFDPEVHEAVATDTTSEFPVHTVVEELQRGYLLHERLLRPALVRVRVDAAHVAEAREEGVEES